jgi:hypothetical protein
MEVNPEQSRRQPDFEELTVSPAAFAHPVWL